MKTVTVNASRSYNILIGSGLLSQLGEQIAALKGIKKICIVSETNVWPLYGKTVQDNLETAGFHVTTFVFPAGEESKNGIT